MEMTRTSNHRQTQRIKEEEKNKKSDADSRNLCDLYYRWYVTTEKNPKNEIWF